MQGGGIVDGRESQGFKAKPQRGSVRFLSVNHVDDLPF